MIHDKKDRVFKNIFHERYIQIFNSGLREKFSSIIAGIAGGEGLFVEVTDKTESSLSLITVSIYDPALFAAYCAVLSMQEFGLAAVDLFTGSVKAARKIRVKISSGNLSPAAMPVMVCEWRVKGKNCFTDEAVIKHVIDLLVQTEKEFKGCTNEEKRIFIDKVTRGILSHSFEDNTKSTEKSGTSQSVRKIESGVIVEKRFSPGYLYVFSLLLQCLGNSALSLMYRVTGGIEISELKVGGVKKNEKTASVKQDNLSSLFRILSICTDVVKSLAYAPDPVKALRRLFYLSESVDEKVFKVLTDCMKNIAIRDSVYRVVGSSDFLWEDFIKSNYVSFLDLISNAANNKKLLPTEREIRKRTEEICRDKVSFKERYKQLNRYKDFILFSIEINHLMGSRPDVGSLANQLTSLANILIAAFISQISLEMEEQYGMPLDNDGKAVQYCVFGLGKLGGAALGFASDLELFFIYEGNGKTTGPYRIEAYEYFDRLVKRFLAVFQTKINGIFEPDMRLRPYGKKGNLATSLYDFKKYYSPEGPSHALERIALFRANLICGSLELNEVIRSLLSDYFSSPGYIRVDELSRARTSGHKHVDRSFNMKHGDGAMVDLETIVQLMQIQNDKASGELWIPEIYKALRALGRNKLLTGKQRSEISDAYYFFRRCINGQRILGGIADSITLDYDLNPDLAPLARRAGYERVGSLEESEQLLMDLRWHSALIRTMGITFLGYDLMSDHSITGIEDIYHRKEIPFRYVYEFINKKGAKISSHFLAVFDELFKMSGRGNYFRYAVIVTGDMILSMREPEVACTRFVIILKQILMTSKNGIERWIKAPQRIRLLISLISNSRTYFYLLRNHPELSELFFFSNQEAKEWYREYLIEELNGIFSTADEKEEMLKRLRILRQKLDFFIAVFTMDGIIKINESIKLLHTFITRLIILYFNFLIRQNVYRTNQKFNPDNPGFAVCIPSPQRISIRPFGTLHIFLVYEDWHVRGCSETVQYKTRSYYRALVKDLCDDLSSVSKDGYVINLSPFSSLYKDDSVFAVSDKVDNSDVAGTINVSSVLAGDSSLLARLQGRLKTAYVINTRRTGKAVTVSDILSDYVVEKCYSCPGIKAGRSSEINCDCEKLYEQLYAIEIALGEDIGSVPIKNLKKYSLPAGNYKIKKYLDLNLIADV